MSFAQVNEEELKTEAENFFENGEFLKAHPLYSQLVSLHPRSQEYNFRFGASTVFNGSDYETAIKHLKYATHKTGVDPRAHYYLGMAQQLNYAFDEAIKAYNNFLNLADAKTLKGFDVNHKIEQCKSGKGLLSQIKDVVVLEKTSSRKEDFFRFFNLDAMGGRLLAMPEELKTKLDKKKGGDALIYYPGSTAKIYFSSYGKDESTGKDIFSAYILPDGSFSDAEKLKGGVNTLYDEDYAFMHPDGKTLYFCSKGHSSMGGYDIFRSIYNPSTDSFSSPENMDFAINTPDDDIFFVSDSSNTTACFASGRSSQQGELHVYKVKVQGIPVQAVFLEGDFISEIAPDAKKAKISVKDEMTGRPIANVSSSVDGGDYIISLPKSGRYLFEVEPSNSTVIHEGIVEVPNFNEPVVLQQELRIIRENGQEILVINNFFENPITERVADYTAQLMRQKSSLDVNASPELIAQVEDEANLTVKRTVENAPMLAGFSENESVESIRSDIKSQATDMFGESEKLIANANKAYSFAEKEFSEAQNLLTESKSLKKTYEGARDEEGINKLRTSQRKAATAREKLIAAEAAIAVADSSVNYSIRLKSRAEKQLNTAEAIGEAASTSDMVQLISLLESERARRKTNEIARDDPATLARKAEELINKDVEGTIRNINRLRAEQSDIKSSIRAAENQKASAKKKEIEELEDRISLLRQEEEDIALRIEGENQKVRSLEQEQELFKEQANIYKEVISRDTEEFVLGKALVEAQKSALISKISDSRLELADVIIRDEETLALLGEETKVSRNDLITTLSLAPKEIESDIELKPVSGLLEDYEESIIELIPQSNQHEKVYKAQLLKADALRNLNAREARLKQQFENAEIDQEEYNNGREEIVAARTQLMERELAVYRSSENSPDREQLNRVISDLNPDYSTDEKNGIEWVDDLKLLAFAQGSETKARKRIEENNERILLSESDSELKELVEENEVLSGYLNNLPNFVGLSEVDKKQRNEIARIGSESSSFQEGLDRQIQSTERYLSLLDEYGEQLEKRSTESENKEDYLRSLQQLNDFKESAQLRLSGLNSDLETASINQVPEQNEEEAIDGSEDVRADSENSAESLNTEVVPEAELPIAEAVAEPLQNNESVTAEESVIIPLNRELPENKNELILTIMPNYPLEGSESASKINSLEERIEAEESLINRVQENIITREKSIVQITEPQQKEKVEVELKKLRALKRQSELSIMGWETAQESAEDQEITSAELGIGQSISEEDKQLFRELNQESGKKDPKQIYEGELFEELLVSNTNPSYNINNLDKIRETRNDISELEQELQSEENERKQKKIDRKIEDLYTKIAFMEIGNGAKVRDMANVRYLSNTDKLSSLEESKAELLDESTYFSNKLDDYLSEAESNLAKAEVIRRNAANVGDPIEKNYRYREAFALEAAAIQNQEKSIRLLENLENLAGKEEVLIAALSADKKADVNAETLNKMKESELDSENDIAQEEKSDQEELENEYSEPMDNEESTASRNENISDVELDNDEAKVWVMNPLVEQKYNQIAEMDILEDISLNQEEKERRRSSEAYVRYQKLMEEAKSRKAELETTLQERNGLRAKTQTLEDRITKLETSIANEEDEAVKEGLEQELKRLRSQAKVNYGRRQLMDEQIKSEETMLAGILNEALVVAEKLRDDQAIALNAPEISSNSTKSTPASIELSDYLFGGSTDFAGKVFEVMDASPYSESQPIPLNAELPNGVVFKVQVGAFRNDIPQDLFGGFAPISGETLSSGITRYTVGLFRQFVGADLAKDDIRGMGYPDAFVVAFIDGQRVPLYEALARLSEEELVQLEAVPAEENPLTESTQAEEAKDLSSSQVGEDFRPSLEDVAYYENAEGVAEANQVETLSGMFYTVQVGVYSKPVSAADLNYIEPLNSERTTGGRVRYSTGVLNNLQDANRLKEEIKAKGINDAFVTAYYNGTRITMQKAADLYEEIGPDVLNITNALADRNAVNEWEFTVYIGSYSGEVPANVAKAMLFLEESRGIVQKREGDSVAYYTGKVNSLSSAKLIQSEFERYEVNSTEIIGFENGIEKDINKYKGD